MDDAEEGFFVLKDEVRQTFNCGPAMTEGLPLPQAAAPCAMPRFVLSGEISTIYKKGNKTRKVHHVIILPDFKAAAAFNARLEGLGANIRSDGRPIMGIDSRDLFALLLEADERSLLIPAHIWTPWFSALGEKSGFDSIEECYGDLSAYIPAVETGLSSNPPMNWALESLDRFSVISNSDAHSPDKIGREATILDMELSYSSLRQALSRNSAAAPSILGTVEFFPQEGKYHYDGHRKCGVSMGPAEAASADYLCPACGKELTRGVMGRVLELATRRVDEEEPCPPAYEGSNRRPYYPLIPLREIIAELFGTGTASKKAYNAYCRLIEKGGTEFSILMDKGRSELEELGLPGLSGETLADAIMAMRAGEISVSPGYDGEYGKIRLFANSPRPPAKGETELFEGKQVRQSIPQPETAATARKASASTPRNPSRKSPPAPRQRIPVGDKCENLLPDPDQEKAISHNGKETIIIAGPGTGKTRVLTERITRIIKEGLDPASILALTFTVKAAAELRERIGRLCPATEVTAATFHSFCSSVLRAHCASAGLAADFGIIEEKEREALLGEIGGRKTANRGSKRLGAYIEERKRQLLLPGEAFPEFARNQSVAALRPDWEPLAIDAGLDALYGEYRQALKKISCLDFEDLVAGTVRLFALRPEILKQYRLRFRYIFVDEYQDINFSQYMLIRLLAPGGGSATEDSPCLWVIGDPNQAIYSFRGSDKRFIDRFLGDYPAAQVFRLSRGFRCAGPIINAAGMLTQTQIQGSPGPAEVSLYRTQYPSDKSEAEGIARAIAALLGGTSFFAFDSGIVPDTPPGSEGLAPEDFAVLVRASALAGPISDALSDHGIPFELLNAPWLKEEPVMAGVKVMTIHASKGLEFEYVFVAGLEEGILPFTLFDKPDAQRIEEERRLLYVAMTRAKRGLWLSWAKSRLYRGRKLLGEPSRFLSDLEKMVPLARHGKTRKWDGQLSLF